MVRSEFALSSQRVPWVAFSYSTVAPSWASTGCARMQALSISARMIPFIHIFLRELVMSKGESKFEVAFVQV